MQADSFGWAALWGAIGAMVTGILAWLTQRNKGDTERDVAVITQWQALTASLSDRLDGAVRRIDDVEKELANVRKDHAAEIAEIRRAHSSEIAQMRQDHRVEIDDMRKKHRAEMNAMRDLNEGLQRMIAQDSQSTARLIGDTPVTKNLKRAFPPAEEGDGK